ncbi:MAG: hypothetical protein IJB88_07040 [Clostridia bacterium]|nr:hypothetical protein [Clostridia bacterium]
MNQKKSSVLLRIAKVFSVMLLLGTFLFLFVFCVFLPRTTVSTYDTLTPFPEFSFSALADGSYTAQLSAYFSDTVFGRDQIKVYFAQLSSLFGKETVFVNKDGVDEIIIGNTSSPEDELSWDDTSSEDIGSIFDESDLPDFSNPPSIDLSDPGSDVSGTSSAADSEEPSTEPSKEPSAEPSEEPSKAPEESSNQGGTLDEELCEGIVILGNRAIEVYYGDPNLKRLPRYASALKSFADKNPQVKVHSMLIPKSAAYYISGSQQFGNLANRTLNDTNSLKELFGSKVNTINIYEALEKHKNEEIYFRTDHHWTALGAYYACEQFAKQLGLPFKELSTYEKNVRPGYLGTMDNYTKRHPNIHNHPEDFVTYVPKATYKATFYDQNFQNSFNRDSLFFKVSDSAVSSWYLTFIGGDSYSVKLESEVCSNGRKLLIVKDSYGNALAPYLLDSFEEVYIVDAREFKVNLNTFVSQNGITDVLFAECAFSAAQSESYINYVENLVK